MNPQAQQRLKILKHWEKYGIASAMHAFGVSRSTLYEWRKRYRQGGLNSANLIAGSRAPRTRRSPNWPASVVHKIKQLRALHHNLGKDKLYALLIPYCQQLGITCPSLSTIGRIIAAAPNKLRSTPLRITPTGKRKPVRQARVLRKPKDLKLSPCQCLAYDTIVRQRDGMKRFILTCIDPVTHIAFAYAPPSGASKHAAALHHAIAHNFPDFANASALTDNGSEFKAHFAKTMSNKGLTHWHTYPRPPKMNAHCERFNRSIQDSFIDYNEDLLFGDLRAFNQRLADWISFYNTELPHLGNKPNPRKHTSATNLPITPLQSLLNANPASSMLWTDTKI